MRILEGLEPKNVFRFFEEMCAIPHGSGNTKAISDWCVAFAKARGLEHYQDNLNNVIIIKEATPGYENAGAVIFQGHLDMVCEKDADCHKDMAREGLDLVVDGDYVYARGTTLGGDDGIAVAMALAILDDDSIPHPRLEAVFTVDEEIGMLGAVDLDVAPLKGKTLINVDSEDEGVFTVSCAGGNITRCHVPIARAAFEGTALTIRVDGLQGGHSGVEIHKGRANACMVLGRALRAAGKAAPMRLIRVDGGLKDNAIPALAEAQIVSADAAAVRQALAELEANLKTEFRVTDPGIRLGAEPCQASMMPMDADSTGKVLCFLSCVPNGVQVMSADIAGLVQTSLNLGILKTGEDTVDASFCVRSSVDSEKQMVKDRLACLTEQLGGTASFSGDYPGWAYLEDSALRELMIEVYREQYGSDPKVEAIHAGVECGMFAGKIPGLDAVSIGPDLLEIHTPRERMSVPSVQRLWKFILEVLRRSGN